MLKSALHVSKLRHDISVERAGLLVVCRSDADALIVEAVQDKDTRDLIEAMVNILIRGLSSTGVNREVVMLNRPAEVTVLRGCVRGGIVKSCFMGPGFRYPYHVGPLTPRRSIPHFPKPGPEVVVGAQLTADGLAVLNAAQDAAAKSEAGSMAIGFLTHSLDVDLFRHPGTHDARRLVKREASLGGADDHLIDANIQAVPAIVDGSEIPVVVEPVALPFMRPDTTSWWDIDAHR